MSFNVNNQLRLQVSIFHKLYSSFILNTDILYIFYIRFFQIFIVYFSVLFTLLDCCSTLLAFYVYSLFMFIIMHQNTKTNDLYV